MKTHHRIMSSYMGQPRRRERQYPRSTSFIPCKIKSGRQMFCVCWVSWCTWFQTHGNITKPCPATVMFLAAKICLHTWSWGYILAWYKESMGSVWWQHLSWSDRKWKRMLVIYTAITLGLLFRLSEVHQCDQEMLLGRFSWKSIEELFFSYISLSLVSEDLFGYIPDIVNHSHATKELSISRCTRSKKQQTSPKMLFIRLSERRY